jgi:integrase
MAKDRGVYLRGKVWWIRYTIHGVRHFEPVGPNRRRAVRARERRLGQVEHERFGIKLPPPVPTFREFVEGPWRREVAIAFKPSTLRVYEILLRIHLIPAFGDEPLSAITRPTVKAFIVTKTAQLRASKSRRRLNPYRARLSRKTIVNMVALLASILESAVVDYELLPANPLRGILRRRNFPAQPLGDGPVRILEPEAFTHALGHLALIPLRAVLFAAFTGLRWSEQTAVRIEEDPDFRANRLHVTRSLYRRVPQRPKTRQSIRRVVMSPLVRRILDTVLYREGYVFSKHGDGVVPLANGNYLKAQWRRAQVEAGIRHPIRWHDLRHQFVSMLIAMGKSPKYIAEQAGHASAGFTLDRYGHLFESVTPTQAEWPEDLICPGGYPFLDCLKFVSLPATNRQKQAGEQVAGSSKNAIRSKAYSDTREQAILDGRAGL